MNANVASGGACCAGSAVTDLAVSPRGEAAIDGETRSDDYDFTVHSRSSLEPRHIRSAVADLGVCANAAPVQGDRTGRCSAIGADRDHADEIRIAGYAAVTNLGVGPVR